jgi:hypothetical protein
VNRRDFPRHILQSAAPEQAIHLVYFTGAARKQQAIVAGRSPWREATIRANLACLADHSHQLPEFIASDADQIHRFDIIHTSAVCIFRSAKCFEARAANQRFLAAMAKQ